MTAIHDMFKKVGDVCDSLTGTQGSIGYVAILALVVTGYLYTSAVLSSDDKLAPSKKVEEEEEEDPPRNFTAEQLRYFDGKKEESKTGKNDDKPVYLSLNGTVFDVSVGRHFYGPDGPYELFGGRECGVALAKMSFEEQHLDYIDGCKKLNFGEKSELEGWIDKFTHYRNYPIKGRLVPENGMLHKPDHLWTKEELQKYNGSQEELPAGYAAKPIYVGAGDKVYDMSFGGVTFYGPGGPYNKFSGKDASRALAKLSLDIADVDNNDLSDLNEKQIKALNDWINTFSSKKKYPVVGILKK